MRENKRNLRWMTAVAGMVCCITSAVTARSSSESQPSTLPASMPTSTSASRPASSEPSEARQLVWLSSLDAGTVAAQQTGHPILVRAGAPWCTWCRQLERDLESPALRRELANWTLIYLDMDRSPEAAEALRVSGIPALRVLSSSGQVIASQDGYVQPPALIGWLTECRAKIGQGTPVELLTEGPPDDDGVKKLLAHLQGRDPIMREAAIRRLTLYPDLAAGSVVEIILGGRLAARLAAMELLEAWHAPLAELDPWRPETFNPQRLSELKAWQQSAGKSTASHPTTLPAEQLATVRSELRLLVKAATLSEAQAIRERLVGWGLVILPEVRVEKQAAQTDAARERLTALIYRLLCSDGLALRWSGGFERLASLDVATRQKAAQELSQSAGPADAGLLLELFAHNDPLVREMALRSLHALGGQETTNAMLNLLQDPEPNIRAAVLKQFSEKPDRSVAVAQKIAAYTRTESDPDLVVHGVRVLRVSQNQAAIDALSSLLTHPSWRVRAEAAEAIGECASQMQLKEEKKADIYVLLLKLLEDSDGFVVSRAVAGLQHADLAAAVDPLAASALKHPELAAEIIGILARGESMQRKAVSHLRSFCTHQDASVRAAAVSGLCQATGGDAEKELTAALADTDSKVRIAAADALSGFINQMRSNHSSTSSHEQTSLLGSLFRSLHKSSRPTSRATSKPESQPAMDLTDQWTERFRAGKGRPVWMVGLVQSLLKMLVVESPQERLAACVPLLALGRDAEVMPVLYKDMARDTKRVIGALPWLPWQDRINLFNQILAATNQADLLESLADTIGESLDPRAAEALWNVLDRLPANSDTGSTIVRKLAIFYFGEQYYNFNTISASTRRTVTQIVKKKAESSKGLRRSVAMVLLLTASPDDAVDMAEKLLADVSMRGEEQAEALQVVLLGIPKNEAVTRAIATIAASEPACRRLALQYLAMGRSSIAALGNRLYVPALMYDANESWSGKQPIVPKPPAGLKAEFVRPLVQNSDKEIAALAGYLLALLGDPAGLDTLVTYWREHGDDRWRWLVYRAVTALNDDAKASVLEEIYGKIPQGDWAVREFYWTIRSMNGPSVIKLRERIRREVGMEKLR